MIPMISTNLLSRPVVSGDGISPDVTVGYHNSSEPQKGSLQNLPEVSRLHKIQEFQPGVR
jgi:hypothetical protein